MRWNASFVGFIFLLLVAAPLQGVSLEGLNEEEKALLHSALGRLGPLIADHKGAGTAPLIRLEQLLGALKPEEAVFLEEVRGIDPANLKGSSRRLPPPPAGTEFVRLDSQTLLRNGRPIRLDPQYLPRPAYGSYLNMMRAMEEDLGKRLLVESGYRSPAYQLYLFLFYLPQHGHSIRETNRHVALPGCSEHGSPDFQAIDFVTPERVNGEDRPEEWIFRLRALALALGSRSE
ncbi:MAG: D-alanyl-D-alanine carboxypeptidase family protein [Candidatus Omnitrophica bacterium]|nr:D-alanyl-D-alanine carboxypeptidase family protein [Candidatus Omnitrophota bacterium]